MPKRMRLMADQTIQIPTVPELVSSASAFNYTVDQPGQTHTHICQILDSNHPIVPLLAQYALLVSAGLCVWENHVGQETSQRPDFSIITYRGLRQTIRYLEQKPCQHYRGWIGEIVIHFLLLHFVAQYRYLLDYAWEEMQPPKTEVTDGELDIVAAYALTNGQLGHVSGEIKTYRDLSQAKSRAYDDLNKARNWSHNRDAQVRSALNALLRARYNVGALQAATLAMGDERSFLPGLIHSAATQFKRQATFSDLPTRFEICTRPAQLIGVQIVISDFGGSCDAIPFQTGFFEDFLRQMRLQAISWKNPTRMTRNV